MAEPAETTAATTTAAETATPAAEVDAFAEALAALEGDAPAEPAAEPAAPAAEPAAETPAEPAQSAAAPQSDETKLFLSRLVRVEHDRDEARDSLTKAQARAAELEQRAQFADALKAKAETDPVGALADLGYTPEQVYDLVVNGKKRDVHQTAAERRLAAVEKELSERKAQESQAAQVNQRKAAIADYKTKIPGILQKELAKEIPATLAAFADDLPGLADELWDVMELSFVRHGKQGELTLGDAARALEKKLARLKAAKPTQTAPAAAAKAPASVLSNVTPTQAKTAPKPEDMTPDELFQAALAAFDE